MGYSCQDTIPTSGGPRTTQEFDAERSREPACAPTGRGSIRTSGENRPGSNGPGGARWIGALTNHRARIMKARSVLDPLPGDLRAEVFEDIVRSESVRIERIVSKGHSSPAEGWYDQDEHEWVMVVRGRACLRFEDGATCELSAGDYVNIPAHSRHRVAWTDPGITIWLAVFYR